MKLNEDLKLLLILVSAFAFQNVDYVGYEKSAEKLKSLFDKFGIDVGNFEHHIEGVSGEEFVEWLDITFSNLQDMIEEYNALEREE